MGRFISDLKWSAVSDKDGNWDKKTIHIDRDFMYITNDGIDVIVNKGFICDGLSIPYGFRWAVKPHGKGLRAGVIHDKIYDNKTKNRKLADKILLECLKDCGVSAPVRGIMWACVRSFGWLFYMLIISIITLLNTGCATVLPYIVKGANYISKGAMIYEHISNDDSANEEEDINDSDNNR
jgi:hypothetical protein